MFKNNCLLNSETIDLDTQGEVVKPTKDILWSGRLLL